MLAILCLLSTLLVTTHADVDGSAGCIPASDAVHVKASAVRGADQSMCVMPAENPGKSKCWGYNRWGILGLGDTTNRGDKEGDMAALPFTPWNGDIRYIAQAFYHRFAHFEDSADQKVQGMGYNDDGYLCLEHQNNPVTSPQTVILGSHADNLKGIYAHGRGGCIIVQEGTDPEKLYCWGRNDKGQLGLGHTDNIGDDAGECGDALVAVDLGSDVGPIKQYYGGVFHQCVLFESLKVKCWGDNDYGQLGRGDTASVGSEPGQMGDNLPYVDTGEHVAKELVMNQGNTCIITQTDQMLCWGQGSFGQAGWLWDNPGANNQGNLGDDPNEVPDVLQLVDFGFNEDGSTPRTVKKVCRDAAVHFCAILNTDEVVCWGNNVFHTCGVEYHAVPGTDYLGDSIDEIGNNRPVIDFSIMQDRDGNTPAGAEDRYAVDIHCTWRGSCATLDDGTLACWGRNTHGGLGQDDTISTHIPRIVSYGGSLAGDCPSTAPEPATPVPAPAAEVEGYTYTAEGCVVGKNIQKLQHKSAAECAELCSAYGTACVGFELYRNYGGSKGKYQPGDCNLQSATDMSGCDGTKYNLDFYTRTNFAGSPDLLSALEALAAWSDSVDLSTQVSCADFDWLSGCTDGATDATPTNDDMVKFTAMVAANYHTLDGFQPDLTVDE